MLCKPYSSTPLCFLYYNFWQSGLATWGLCMLEACEKINEINTRSAVRAFYFCHRAADRNTCNPFSPPPPFLFIYCHKWTITPLPGSVCLSAVPLGPAVLLASRKCFGERQEVMRKSVHTVRATTSTSRCQRAVLHGSRTQFGAQQTTHSWRNHAPSSLDSSDVKKNHILRYSTTAYHHACCSVLASSEPL